MMTSAASTPAPKEAWNTLAHTLLETGTFVLTIEGAPLPEPSPDAVTKLFHFKVGLLGGVFAHASKDTPHECYMTSEDATGLQLKSAFADILGEDVSSLRILDSTKTHTLGDDFLLSDWYVPGDGSRTLYLHKFVKM